MNMTVQRVRLKPADDDKMKDMEKNKTLSMTAEFALLYFRNGLYCSEAILRAFNEVYKLGLPGNVYKISTGFGSGLGGSGCVCGTVSSATMVFGLAAGRNKSHESEKAVFSAVKKLHKRFSAEHKALCCRVLTKNVRWGSGKHKKQCESFILDVVIWTEEILQNDLNCGSPESVVKPFRKKNVLKYLASRLRGGTADNFFE